MNENIMQGTSGRLADLNSELNDAVSRGDADKFARIGEAICGELIDALANIEGHLPKGHADAGRYTDAILSVASKAHRATQAQQKQSVGQQKQGGKTVKTIE